MALFIVVLSALLTAVPCEISNNDVYGHVTRPNVLFIVADDMRPQLTTYGHDSPSRVSPIMHTPNLDRLAGRSFVAGRAHVQYAMCGPSRTSLLTGRRPDTTHVYDNLHYFRNVGGNFTTIPQYFKQNGYVSVGMGKIFHPGVEASGNDDPPSWSRPYWHPSNEDYWWSRTRSWIAVTAEMRKLKPLPDEQTTFHAIKTLKDLAPKAKTGEQPFFLAVGLLKPHLPFVFPEEFLEFYPPETINLPDNGFAPFDMPPVAWNPYYELRTYHDISSLNVSGAINTTLPDAVIRDLRRAYYSALSFTDSLIGILLREIQALGLQENTIVSFLGDHGWQLGEHGEWCKQTNFELSTHAPLMVSVPGLTDQGHFSENLIEFVDLFPTLVDLTGFPKLQSCPRTSHMVDLCTEGHSFALLMRNHPKNKRFKVKGRSGKRWAFSQFRRFENGSEVMGYTMRTNRFRYTEWVEFTPKPSYKPQWHKLHGVEMYDHFIDPDENRNMVNDSKYSKYRKRLQIQLHKGWRGARYK